MDTSETVVNNITIYYNPSHKSAILLASKNREVIMNKALLVLDFINDIVHRDGKIATSANFIKEKQIIENTNRAIAFARSHETLAIQPEDIVITKHRISAFYNTSLEAILRANHIDTLILSGVSTNMVIESTAREAHDRDYRVIILEDACAAATHEIHQQAIALLSRLAEIRQVDELEKFFV